MTGETGAQKEQAQLAAQQQAELQAKLDEEKRKKEAQDKLIQQQKLQRLRSVSGSGGGLFSNGSDTLG